MASYPAARPKEGISEKDFQKKVIKLAEGHNWFWCHCPSVFSSGKWRVPLAGSPGFPDLVLARDGLIVLVELKSDTGRLRPGQAEWISAANGKIWRPRDWEEIVEFLQ